MRTLGMVSLVLLTFALGACSSDGMDETGVLPAPDAAAIAEVPDAAPDPADAAVVPEEEPPPSDFPIELACSLDEISPLVECVTDNCLDSLDNGLITCVTFSCGLLILGLPPQCSQCIFTGLTDTSMALDACVLGLDDLGLPPLPQP